MDNAILEVVIGLVLIYATLALLVMKFQELLAGNALRYRAGVLHRLVHEAVGQNDELKARVLANPRVYALFEGDQAAPGVRDSGPSSIPPDLFARALLAELNGGQPPAAQFGAPSAFLAAKAPAGYEQGGASSATRIWRTLAQLLPGRVASWPDFEAAIGRWFSAIGDRSDGWFKRKATIWSFWLALALCALLNVDSFHIASTLAADPQLRLGLADLGARVAAAREADSAGNGGPPMAAASLATRPHVQISVGLTDAMTRLSDAFTRDKAIGLYRANLVRLEDHCAIARGPEPKAAPKSDTTSTVAKTVARQAGRPDASGDYPAALANPPSGLLARQAMLGNSDIWILVLPILQAKIDSAQIDPGDKAGEPANTYRQAHTCLAHVASWVRAATSASSDASVRLAMQEAAVSLESAKSGLLALSQRQQPSTSLQRAFLTDPAAFDTCAAESTSRAAFDSCLARELKSLLRLPVFHGGANTRSQFCKTARTADTTKPVAGTAGKGDSRVVNAAASSASATSLNLSLEVAAPRDAAATAAAAAAAAAAATGRISGPCDWQFAGKVALGLPALALVPGGGAGPMVAWLLGVLTTAIFVSLGAPFWFDLLGKVVKLRSAGTVRDDNADLLKGRGNKPPGGGGSPTSSRDSAPPGPFSAARNAFEDSLLPADIVRLQQRRGVEASGWLDGPTRELIRQFCREQLIEPPTDELSAPLYLQITGRAASQAPVAAATGRITLGSVHEQVPALAKALPAALNFSAWASSDGLSFGPDLRALTVLYRYKRERGVAAKDRQVFAVARDNPKLLAELDEALIDEMLRLKAGAIARESPAWMDWAIGELGQVEINSTRRQDSNPRICSYLDLAVAGAGDAGDHKPWCGGFVAWVLRRHLATLAADDPLKRRLEPPKEPLLAVHWKDWGDRRDLADARSGDIVLFKPTGPDSSGHVAFVVACDAGTLWALGGNQQEGSRVGLAAFKVDDVVTVRKVSTTTTAT